MPKNPTREFGEQVLFDDQRGSRYDSFSDLERSIDLFFSMQSCKMADLKKYLDQITKKNEVNFCSTAVYEIYNNLAQLSNEEKLYICYQLRDSDLVTENEGEELGRKEEAEDDREVGGLPGCLPKNASRTLHPLIHDEIFKKGEKKRTSDGHRQDSSNDKGDSTKGDASFVIKFETLTTDQIHYIWNYTDKYV